MSSFTCISCHVVFPNAELQRGHYKSDWHRYNLKRKVAGLTPVTIDLFEQRALIQAESESGAKDQETVLYCSQCRKSFGNQKAYENHQKSKRHLEVSQLKSKSSDRDTTKGKRKPKGVIAIPGKTTLSLKTTDIKYKTLQGEFSDDADSDWESCSDEEDEEPGFAIPPNECLFCSYENTDLESNIHHMTEQHSFFIPDIEYLTDLEGLITYLGEKVGEGRRCLWCCDKGKAFLSTKAVQQHMVDKGHCKMLHEGEALLEYEEFYDYSSSYPEDKGDTEADSEITIPELDGTGWQLVLPSGVVIGHRSLARYYKQSLPPETRKRESKTVHRLMSHYKALGWKETEHPLALQKARDLKFMKRVQDKNLLKLGLKQNKFQPHFRPQVVF